MRKAIFSLELEAGAEGRGGEEAGAEGPRGRAALEGGHERGKE